MEMETNLLQTGFIIGYLGGAVVGLLIGIWIAQQRDLHR